MYAQLIDLPWTMGLYINHFMLDLSKIILFTTAKKKNPLCPSYFKRDSNIHVWNKTNWEEHSDTKDIYNGFNLETISCLFLTWLGQFIEENRVTEQAWISYN